MYNLANSILEECKNAALVSDLNTAIYLFREVLKRQPAPHPLRSDSLRDLADTLVTRFCLTKQREDLEQSVLLRGGAQVEHGIPMGTGGQFQPGVRVQSNLSDV